MAALRLLSRFIVFVKILILARLLSPEEFGLFGIASITLALLEVLTDTGINAFLIQEDSDIRKYLNSAWLVSIFRGFLISCLILVLSLPLTKFFDNQKVLRFLVLISLTPFLRGFVNPAIIKFQKYLEFDKEFYLRTMIFFFDALISVSLAFRLRSAESLIWGLVAGTVLELIFSFLFVKPTPKLKFEKAKLSRVISRGKWITLAGIFDYLFHHLDDVFVGKLLNTSALGLYQVAYKISTLPITEGGEIVSKVAFPVYSKISNHRNQLKIVYLKVLALISLVTLPFGLIFILFAKPFVSIFLGGQWLEMVPVVKVLVVFGVVRAISGSSSSLFLALKKQEYITLVTFVSMLGLILPLFPLIKVYGLVGASYSALIGSLLALPLMFYFLRKEI